MEDSTDRDEFLAQKYAVDFDIPIELAQILSRRYPEYHKAKEFLFPDITHLHHPDTMPDIETATEEIIKTVNDGQGILIYCHDDPDGYTSAAIIYKTLLDLHRGGKEQFFIYPIIREKDGYILNLEVLRGYQAKGVRLLITADFGISNPENFRIAKDEGLKLVVCDHHETDATKFLAPAVDPKRCDSNYPFRELAGVGVCFKLSQAIYQKAFKLKPAEFYNLKKEFFAIAMVGTIADRVIMVGENRILCHHGLKIINELNNHWVRFLKNGKDFNIARVNLEIIPILVSAANLDPSLGIKILISDNFGEVSEIIEKLKGVDENRKKEIDDLFQEAISASKTFSKLVISVLPLSKIHYLGVVSSRLRDYFQRTAVAIGIKEGKCYGEFRSYDIDSYKLLQQMSSLFLDFGGHIKAAGFSMKEENLDKFIEKANDYAQKFITESTISQGLNGIKKPEAFLDKSQISILTPLMPFGDGNPAPVLTDGVDQYTIDNKFNIINKGIWRT